MMKPERWVEIENLYNEVVDLDPSQRDKRLAMVANQDLRREVLSLVQAGPLSSDIAAWLKQERGRVLLQQAAAAAGHDAVSTYSQISIPHAFKPGDLLVARYRIVGVLGQGGMGEVYEAEDQDLRERVALKVIGSQAGVDKTWVERFRREVQLARRVTHPNVCRVFDLQHHREGDRDLIFLTMELVRGETLASRLGRTGRLSIADAIPIAAQLCAALHAAHQAGVLHRDFKCGNVMLAGSGQQARAVVTDFGTALPLDSAHSSIHTTTGALVGTPAYMSPEQLAGKELTAASDIYSLGLVLYEMVTGRRPFQSDSAWTEAMKRLSEDPQPPSSIVPEIGDAWNSTILRCVERDPAKRFSSAQEVSDFLEGMARLERDPEAKSKVRMKKWPWALAAVLAPALALVFFMVFRAHPTRALTARDVVVLADFTNNTGEQVFDGTLKEALAIDLEQSPLLNILSDLNVAQMLKLMGRQGGDRLTPDVAREVCLRSNSSAMIAGSIARLGSHYAIHLKATECQTGNLLGAAEAEADSRENTLQALGRAATLLRSKVGESLASVQRFDKPLPEATTSSLEALQAYSAAMRPKPNETAEASIAEAIQFLERAVKLDPNFAVAHARLGSLYGSINQRRLLVENMSKAYELRDRVTEREAYDISGLYYTDVTGELLKAIQQYQLCVQEYPNYASARFHLGGIYEWLGQYDAALRETTEAVRVAESSGSKPANWGALAYPYFALNRLDEAQALLDQDLSQTPEAPTLHFMSYLLAFMRNDEAAMMRESAWAKARPSPGLLFAVLESGIEGSHGRLRQALAISHALPKEFAVDIESVGALHLTDFGYAKQARRTALTALADAAPASFWQLFGPGSPYAVAALALARAGDTSNAQRAAKALDQEAPLDTLVQNFWLPTIKAEMEIASGRAAKAIELLQVAKPYDLNETGAMASIYTRGRAYLALGDGPAAAQEFENMLNPAHNQVVWMRFPKALAYLGLARARTLQAHSATGAAAKAASDQALTAYQNFFALWKDADPDIPALRQAKAEYAKLVNKK